MKPDTLLDYAVFQLSPRRSRCELFASRDGNTEKLASGLVKPFVAHLKVAEDQVALAAQSIKLEVDKRKNDDTWFTKGTLERFVRFVSTPDVLEMVNTFDTEMSQLEAARRIYSQGAGDQHGASGGDETGVMTAADATKKELLRAIDVRLVAVRQDLIMACSRASAAGFNVDTVSELQLFADQFGAHRLKEACSKFISLGQRQPGLISPWKPPAVDIIRSSIESDMSIDDPAEDLRGFHNGPRPNNQTLDPETKIVGPNIDQSNTSACQQPNAVAGFQTQQRTEADESSVNEKKVESQTESPETRVSQLGRRLSVQDRINLFENKQKETSGGKPVVGKLVELRRLSSDVSSAAAAAAAGVAEKAVLRRWSGASDMSTDLSGEKKDNTDKNHKLLGDINSSAKFEVKSDSDFSGKDEEAGLNRDSKVINDQVGGGSLLRRYLDSLEVAGVKTQTESGIKIGALQSRSGEVSSDSDSANRVEDGSLRDEAATQLRFQSSKAHSRSLSEQLEDGFGLNFREGQTKRTEQLNSQPQWKSFTGEMEETGNKVSESFVDSRVQRMKFQKLVKASPEQIGKSQGGRDEDGLVFADSKLVFPGKKVLENQGSFDTISTPPVEKVQRVRQSKGNQELNDELKMKAKELEKLFAEHKLRVPGDQSSSTRRVRPADVQMEQAVSLHSRKPAAETEVAFVHLPEGSKMIEPTESSNTVDKLSLMTVENQDDGNIRKQKFSELGFSNDSRGKFYESYMQKRNVKLMEESSSKRVEKETKMKALHDSLERSRAEMKAKLSGMDGQNSVSSARRRTEKLRSFNFHSSLKREHSEDEDLSEFQELKLYEQDRFSSETFVGDLASRSTQSRKIMPTRILSSSAPRTVAAPLPRYSVKASNSGSGRRRAQLENPLAQSVPSLLDFKKENTKPSSGVSKMTTRSQVRNYARSALKSTSEETNLLKEEKPRRSQPLRKNSASSVDLKDSSPLNSDGDVLVPVKFDKDQTDQSICDKFPKKVDAIAFLKKGSGVDPGAGTSITKLKSSIASESLKDEEESDELAFVPEDSADGAKEEEEEEFQTVGVQDYATLDSGKPSLTQEFGKLDTSGSENGDSLRSLSQVDPASVAELPTAFSSHAVGSLQNSPGESPMSWNSRIHNPFSYPHETSDIDASVDSPVGSPAYWNSHSLTQTEADAARMRKKWGSAQKPILVASSSHTQSRKDVTKGFKRLLQFGRKNRGSESLVDWISATTSEGDDDTEDGRDPANRSSEDLRKSRMGFSQRHSSDDGFIQSEFNEQVQELRTSIPAPPMNFKLREDHMSGSALKAPRSFFSLSSFRSKGSDTKPR